MRYSSTIKKFFIRSGLVGLLLCFAAGHFANGYDDPPLPYPTNNDPTRQIRFNTPAEANARRQQLVNFIWPNGLPTTTMPGVLPNAAFDNNLSLITQSYVSRVDKLDGQVYGLHNLAYLLTPTNTAHADRVVIVHAGHAPSASEALVHGIADTANALLREGYRVLTMQMPLMGWNRAYNVCTPPGLGTVTINNLGSSIAHDELFAKVEPTLGGQIFRFFLEPIVQAINYVQSTIPGLKDVSMVGLSGGAWTTHMMAAVDPRIKLSIPVSGSWPLYIRNLGKPADYEQVYFPLYDENIALDGSGGGIATWLECYALGGYGAGRRQIMMNNLYEPEGLYGGSYADSFKNIVANVVANQLQAGQWEHISDVSQNQHIISPWTIDNVILPALSVPEPSSITLTMFTIISMLGFLSYKRKR